MKNAKLIPANAARVFHGEIFDVYQWPQQLFDGSTATFEMIKRDDTVTVLAVRDGKMVILKQKQPDTDDFYGIPGGRHDHEDETELDAAKRECTEESGMTFKNWKLVHIQQPVAKMDWFIYTFLATDFIKEVPQKLDAGEKISVQLMTIDEIKNVIANLSVNSRMDLPREIFDKVETIDDLLNLPEYSDKC